MSEKNKQRRFLQIIRTKKQVERRHNFETIFSRQSSSISKKKINEWKEKETKENRNYIYDKNGDKRISLWW